MTTKLKKLGEIWSDWNEHKIFGDNAMLEIGKAYPEVLKVWNNRQNKKEVK